jgi:CrcB protein
LKSSMDTLLVFAGGGTGALFRWWLSSEVQNISKNFLFPYGTLTVNLIGSFILGFVMGATLLYGVFTRGQRLFLATGFAGAFTTFSTFEYETFRLIIDAPRLALLYSIVSILLGLLMVYLGYAVAGIVYK